SAPVVDDRLVDPPLPARALRDELWHVVRALRHAHAVGQAVDHVVAALPPELLVDAKRELDVLARELRRVPANLLEDVPTPDLEAARRAHHEAVLRLGEPVVEEGAEEVEMLVEAQEAAVHPATSSGLRENALRFPRRRDLARDPDDASRIGHREAHDLQQRLR